jgi:hypothetical protein
VSRFAFALVGAILLAGNHTISEYLRAGLAILKLPVARAATNLLKAEGRQASREHAVLQFSCRQSVHQLCSTRPWLGANLIGCEGVKNI